MSAIYFGGADLAGGGAVLSQQLQAAYGFDAAGNRVRVRTEGGGHSLYSYDASGRMLQGVDDKAGDGLQNSDQLISQIVYDGHGNRVSETRAVPPPATSAPSSTASTTSRRP